MAVTKGYEDLRKAKQRMRKIDKEKQFGYKAFEIGGETLGFLQSQKDRAKTAWEEYEEGYKFIGGDISEIERPKGFLKMPEDKVTLDGREYNMENIRKLGSFYKKYGAFATEDVMTKYQRILGLIDKESIADLGPNKTILSTGYKRSERTGDYQQFLDDEKAGRTTLSWREYKKEKGI